MTNDERLSSALHLLASALRARIDKDQEIHTLLARVITLIEEKNDKINSINRADQG